jgi:hypothetical protein
VEGYIYNSPRDGSLQFEDYAAESDRPPARFWYILVGVELRLKRENIIKEYVS